MLISRNPVSQKKIAQVVWMKTWYVIIIFMLRKLSWERRFAPYDQGRSTGAVAEQGTSTSSRPLLYKKSITRWDISPSRHSNVESTLKFVDFRNVENWLLVRWSLKQISTLQNPLNFSVDSTCGIQVESRWHHQRNINEFPTNRMSFVLEIETLLPRSRNFQMDNSGAYLTVLKICGPLRDFCVVVPET